MPPWAWWAVAGVNVAVFLLYGWDKALAKLDRRRIREATLLWGTFLCGCVGAWCGMSLFRHKTRKTSFRWRAIALTVLNPLWLLVWLQLH